MSEKKQSGQLSRREFLKSAALTAGAVSVGGLFLGGGQEVNAATPAGLPVAPEKWDYEADVVIIGSGGAGLPAALKAREEGASVLIVECNWDIGGHAATSGGNLHSGGGIEQQKKFDIEDSPDKYYLDHTTNLTSESRYNDRNNVRAIANAMPEAFQFILDNGVLLMDRAPTKGQSYLEGGTSPETVPRDTLVDVRTLDWVSYLGGVPPSKGGRATPGMGLVRPLEKAAREKGVRFLLNYHMDKIFREGHLSGKVLGIEASYTPTMLPGQTVPLRSMNTLNNIITTQKTVNIKANKSIIITTGGHTSNVKFRTLFDPRLTEEYDGVAGDPFSFQDASGELAALAIGASLGATANQTQSSGAAITHPWYIGCQYGYRSTRIDTTSPIFPLVRAQGLSCTSYEGVILVNMLGQRFWNEDDTGAGSYSYDPYDYFAAAMASVVVYGETDKDARRLGGPIWAIFDEETAKRNKWDVTPPNVDIEDGRFFSGETLEELAQNIINKYYTDIKMDPQTLLEAVTAYNTSVDTKSDPFGKKTLEHKIQTGPFYAAWATPCLHDTLTGIRVNEKQQVLDIYAEPIPGLFCAGESAAGQKVHGFGRVITMGYIAGACAANPDISF